jgi:pilus assembly protein Flp/PilA
MKRLHEIASCFFVDESGVTSIEYALIAVLISVAVVVTVASAGSSLKTLFTTVASCLPSGNC